MSTTDAALPPFTEIVERHGATVWRVCRAVGGTPDAVRRAAADGLATLRRTYGSEENA